MDRVESKNIGKILYLFRNFCIDDPFSWIHVFTFFRLPSSSVTHRQSFCSSSVHIRSYYFQSSPKKITFSHWNSLSWVPFQLKNIWNTSAIFWQISFQILNGFLQQRKSRCSSQNSRCYKMPDSTHS
jgi:hypothetical protein